MFSVTDFASFEEIFKFHRQILRVKDRDEFPMLMVGNKSDLEAQRVVSWRETFEWSLAVNTCLLLGFPWESARTESSVEDPVSWVQCKRWDWMTNCRPTVVRCSEMTNEQKLIPLSPYTHSTVRINVDQAFYELVRIVRKFQISERPLDYKDDNKRKSKKKCCVL